MSKEFISSHNAILARLMEQEEINQLKEKLGIVDKKVDEKADVTDVDTKLSDVDKRFNDEKIRVDHRLDFTDNKLGEKVDSSDVYLKHHVDTKLSDKVNNSEVYKKLDVDTKLGGIDSKINNVDTRLTGAESEFVNINNKFGEVDTKLGDKADRDVYVRLDDADNVRENLKLGLKPDGKRFTLDEVDHGLTYRKVKSGAVTESGQINLKSTHVINKLFTENQSDNLKSDKTVNGKALYHVEHKPTKGDLGLQNVENKSSSQIRSEITKDNVLNTNFGKSDIGLGSVENKSSSQIRSEISKANVLNTNLGKSDLGLGSVENKSSSQIRSEITKDNVLATSIAKSDLGLGNVENKSVVEIKNDLQYSGGVQLIENDWALGSGATGFFNLNGNSSENYRVLGTNPHGEKSILWECRPDSSSGPDGGWVTDYFKIDRSKLYRFSVFVKTNSSSGTTYLGCKGGSVCGLNSSTKNTNPYFWSGDLPSNNKWYLIVGYVFPAGQTGLSTQGGIYDCETGKKVANISRSFNWANDAVQSYHRCYHYYDTTTSTRQWMYHPRVDLVNGNEPSILALLGTVTPESIGARANNWLPTPSEIGAITSSQASSIADGRITTKIGSTTVISRLKDGKKADGTYPTAANIGARSSSWKPSVNDVQGLSTEISSIKSDINKVESDIDKVETDINDVNNQITTLKDDPSGPGGLSGPQLR